MLRHAARLNPKSIEKSAMITISLFAASSIALQGFVVASGNISGRTSGVAQAAATVVPKSAAAAIAPPSSLALARVPLVAAPRGDRLLDAGKVLAEPDGRLSPRIAALVPADTIIAKSPAPADIGLRTSTFAPSLRGSTADAASGALPNLSPRHGANGAVVQTTVQPVTKVAYAAAATQGLGRVIARDHGEIIDMSPPSRAPRIIGRGKDHVPEATLQKVHFQDHTPNRCLPNELMKVVYDVAEKFGEVQILSTLRDPQRNRRVGGAPRSFHLRCEAIDFRVMGRTAGLLEYLEQRPEIGGLKRYPLGFFHIDTGPRRSW